jgi:hypothetical protein
MAGRHLGCYGWDAVAWPTEIGTTMTIPLIRNTSGHQIDEAERLHRAAGVTHHKAHHAYIAAVAATVEAAGIVIGDIGSDCDEPRGGNFRIGGDLEDFWDDDEGYGPSMVIQWREDRGWYHIWFSDSQAALGDYTEELPGNLPLMATPEQVAGAIQALVPERCQCGSGKPPAVPAWQMPRGYEGGPALRGRRRVGRVAPARAVADRLRRVAAPGRPPGMAGPFSADNCHYPLSPARISVDNDVSGSAVAGAELSG